MSWTKLEKIIELIDEHNIFCVGGDSSVKKRRLFSERYHCTFCAKMVWHCKCKAEGRIEHDTRHLILLPAGCLMVTKERVV